MRSIRRTSITYLLLLLVLALTGVSLLVDRLANAAVHAREESESERIEQSFELRKQEAKSKLDVELRADAKALSRELSQVFRNQPRSRSSDEDNAEFRLRALSLVLADPRSLVASAEYCLTSRSSIWSSFVLPRPANRIRETIRKAFEEEEHLGLYQFHVVQIEPNGTARTTGIVRPARLGGELPLDVNALHRDSHFEQEWDTVEIPGKGKFRRIVVPVGGTVPVWVNPVSPLALGPGGPRGWPPRRPEDFKLRIFLQTARLVTELENRIADFAVERDDHLANVRQETHLELTQLRTRLALIGGLTFIALLSGCWIVIGRGLAPVGKLSVAVSQVTEKDFSLPHDGKDLPRELAPIHARINQTLELLHRAFAREKQSVADISHELRTPIASLMAIFDVTLRKPRTPEQYRNALVDCRAITKQLGQLVERIMTLASLDAGSTHTVSVRSDGADIGLTCAAMIRPLAEAQGLTLDVDAPEQVELDTDPDKLREVLINLLHNAVEYNQIGGQVTMTIRREGDTALFEVSDTGIGMSEEIKERIFERFFRADSSRHATGVHAGLGLSIVKEYIDRLGGTITVASEVGVGTTFRVLLPAATDEPMMRDSDTEVKRLPRIVVSETAI